MRVIAGKARGIKLTAPPGRDIRPTLDRVRESLFNILGPRLAEARFLDLYAGTGANGLEALSRGAAAVTFVDKDTRALAVVRANLERTRLVGRIRCAKLNLPAGLDAIHGSFDIIFADPPYDFSAYDALAEAVAGGALLAEGGELVIEHRRTASAPECAGRLTRTRCKQYGDTMLSFFS